MADAAPLILAPPTYAQARQALAQRLLAPDALPRLRRTLQGLARLTDGHLRSLWAQAGLPEHLALVAVGGYGRGELYPASDVDVLILLPEGCDASLPPLQGALEAFIGACWDTGLEIGSSVRTLGQCLEESARDRKSVV